MEISRTAAMAAEPAKETVLYYLSISVPFAWQDYHSTLQSDIPDTAPVVCSCKYMFVAF